MQVRVRFRCPRIVIEDPYLEVYLDETAVYEGEFMVGFDVTLDVAPGVHVLETRLIGSRGQTRVQYIELAVPTAGYREQPTIEAHLAYSQISANFEPRARIRRIP